MIGVRADHRHVDQIDDAQVRGFGGIAQLDRLDITEHLALALGNRQQLARLDQGVDLLECLGKSAQAVRFVEHEIADELFQAADALE